MSLSQPILADQTNSNDPELLNLGSNNPFRKPSLPSTEGNIDSRTGSRNPFLSTHEQAALSQSPQRTSFASMATKGIRANHGQTSFTTTMDDLFKNLSTNDEPLAAERMRPRLNERHSSTTAVQKHSQMRSMDQNHRMGTRGPASRSRNHGKGQNIFLSPEKGENRRPRRNSESSIAEKRPNVDNERRRRERRYRDGETVNSSGKRREHASSRAKKPKGLDLIDKLDVTGIYGPGSSFHHDGPFDACNPHRNRKKDHRAPMHAFPAGSANNAVGGSGPVNKNIDVDAYSGRVTQGFTDFAASGIEKAEPLGKKRSSIDRLESFNPKGNEIIHGVESSGLGTSTFLEGAPASKVDIERRENEVEMVPTLHHGPTRSRSIAQRFRGLSQPRRTLTEGGRLTSPIDRYGIRSPKSPGAYSPVGIGPSTSKSYNKGDERNPFFEEYRGSFDKKDAAVRVSTPEYTAGDDIITVNRERALSSPRRTLERRATNDDGYSGEAKTGSLLSRVKSLKGGKKARPEARYA